MSEIIREHFQLKETIVTISARETEHIEAAKASIREQRAYLEEYIRMDPYFQITLEPYDLFCRPGGSACPAQSASFAPSVPSASSASSFNSSKQSEHAKQAGHYVRDAPLIAIRMAECSAVFGIGPMAAVAGAIAAFAVQAMKEQGATYAVVDNGGDICILNDQPILVGIYAGCSPIRDLAFRIPARDMPLGICTSSGTVGPSISFGFADAAVVISQDVILADAAATALGNAGTSTGPLEDCFLAIDRPGIDGALIIRGDKMALWGEIPKLARGRIGAERITRA